MSSTLSEKPRRSGSRVDCTSGPAVGEPRQRLMGAGREQALPRGGRTAEGVVIYRLSGAFFFGTASTVGAVFDRIDSGYRAFVIDFSAVPFIDSTAANVMAGIGRRAARKRHSRRRGSRA